MDITITLNCNNNCIFCPRHDYLKLIVSGSLKENLADIQKIDKNSKEIALSGGEVTLVNDIFKIIKFCRNKKIKTIGIVTNGRKLSDIQFAKKLILAGVNDFAISIYSLNDKLHDRITQKNGSCLETKIGLKNLLNLQQKYNFGLRINTVLNYWNNQDLLKSILMLNSMGIKNFIVAEQIILNSKDKHLSIKNILGFLRKLKKMDLNDSSLKLRGFPFCLLVSSGLSSYKDSIILMNNSAVVYEPQDINTLIKTKKQSYPYFRKFEDLYMKTEKCRICFLKKSCKGIQKKYF